MNDDTERVPWKRDTSALLEMNAPQLEEAGFGFLLLYDKNGPQHPEAKAWIEGAMDVATRLHEIALERKSLKLLQLSQALNAESFACAQQLGATQQYLQQKSGIVRAVEGALPPPNSGVWRK